MNKIIAAYRRAWLAVTLFDWRAQGYTTEDNE